MSVSSEEGSHTIFWTDR